MLFHIEPTEEQQNILDAIWNNPDKNFLIEAAPGTGKTTVLAMFETMRRTLNPDSRAVFLTYSKELSLDMQLKIMGEIYTAHAFSYQMLREYAKKKRIRTLVFDDDGPVFVEQDLVNKLTWDSSASYYGMAYSNVPKKDKKKFFGRKNEIEACVDWIRKEVITDLSISNLISKRQETGERFSDDCLAASADAVRRLINHFITKGQTDFDGMLYLPFVLEGFDEVIPHLDYLLVDEVNDSGKQLREFYKLILSDDTQYIGTGDPYQTIHIWNGTEPNCFDIVREEFSCEVIKCYTSFRLPQSGIKLLHNIGVDTRIQPFEPNPDGNIAHIALADISNVAKAGDLVICRYNKGTGYNGQSVLSNLWSNGKIARLLGFSVLELICNKFSDSDDIEADVAKFWNNANVNYRNLRKKSKRWQADKILTQARLVVSLFNLFKTKALRIDAKSFIQFASSIEEMPPEMTIEISSIHRSKGREAQNVFVVGLSDLGVYSSKSIELEDLNLLEVALSRHKDTIYIVDSTINGIRVSREV